MVVYLHWMTSLLFRVEKKYYIYINLSVSVTLPSSLAFQNISFFTSPPSDSLSHPIANLFPSFSCLSLLNSLPCAALSIKRSLEITIQTYQWYCKDNFVKVYWVPEYIKHLNPYTIKKKHAYKTECFYFSLSWARVDVHYFTLYVR